MQSLRFILDLPGVSVVSLRAFHASPEALRVLTPPGMLDQVSGDLGPLHEGQRLTLHLERFGFPLRWEAVNESVGPDGFVDRMVSGPFKAWSHLHRFEATDTGARLVDEITFQLPWWPLSMVALPLVLADIRRLFAFRHKATRHALIPGIPMEG